MSEPEFNPDLTGVLFFSRGRGRGHAIPDMVIAEELCRLRNDLDVRFVSYATGAATFAEFGHAVIDLDLPERNSVAETLERSAKLIGRLRPQLVVAHEEFTVPAAAKIFDLPVVFITDWFVEPESPSMQALVYADEILFIDERGTFEEPPFLAGKTQFVGPVLRSFTYSNADRSRARQELGLAANAVVISVFVHPGRRTEEVAPIFDLLMPAFDSIQATKKILVWLAGEDHEMLAKRTKDRPEVMIKERDWPFDRLMVASDLGITKGNRNTALELAFLGVPSISISHGLNRIDDLRTSKISSNRTLHANEIDSHLLAKCMRERLSNRHIAKADNTSAAFADGKVGAAQRLAVLFEELSEKAKSASEG